MFKGILPSKRISSSEFTMITPLGDSNVNGKENQAGSIDTQPLPGPTKNVRPLAKGFPQSFDKRKRSAGKAADLGVAVGMNQNEAFDKLLDDLQIPSSLRPKLLGMDSTVKAAMIKSSQVMTLPKPPASPPATPRSTALRRTRSIESISSPLAFNGSMEFDLLPPQAPFASSGQVSAHHPSSGGGSTTPRKSSGHMRGASFDSPGLKSRSQVNLTSASVVDLSALLGGKSGKDKGLTQPTGKISPTKFISILSGTSSTQIDVENIKKLRLMLRNESASWSQEFLWTGGYAALLTRLNELLEVEWREEQHDDQVLHELLRCIKAMSTSSIGCAALRSSCPTPFVQLVALLYSDKRPGDIATRQLIVELLTILFELYPPSSLPALSSSASGSNTGRFRAHREVWDAESPSPTGLISLPAPHKTLFSLIRALLLTPAPPPAESPASPVAPHEFIESLHVPRIYKTYLQELSDVCRDYFWVFCHPNNTIWLLSETDETRVEKPRAPGGMTGGVEFEAMGYFTTHLKLINAIAKAAGDLNLPKDSELSAHRFHSDLFLSGFERIILISRKASTTYYPTLHLELARYIAHAGRSGYELPWTVSRLIGLPPSSSCKNPTSGRSTPAAHSTPNKQRTGSKPGPFIPSPRKVDPIRLEK